MSLPSISLITPVLNERDTLTQTLESVRSQSVPPFEHIIVDSGSTDGSLEIIENYASSAHYPVQVVKAPAEGVYAALNLGNRQAKGEVIGLLHGDDFFSSPGVLEFVATTFARNVETDLVYGDVHYVNKRGRRTRYYSGAHFRPASLHEGFAFPHPSMYVRRSAWNKIGDYDTTLRIAADYEWAIRATLIHASRILYLPLDMVAMHEGGLAFQWSNRFFTHIPERRRALRQNGFRAPFLRMLGRYLYLFRH